MDLSANEIVGLFDRIGIVAFAFSGVEAGTRRRLDVFGLLVMGIVTATGGGVLRDVVLARRPFVLVHADYLLWAALATGAAIMLVTMRRAMPRAVLGAADAAGVGAFAAAGAIAAIDAGLPFPAIVLLAIITATGGGVMRDLLLRRVPLVLRSELQATAAALGAFVVWGMHPWSENGAALGGAAIAAVTRGASLIFALQLPRLGTATVKDDGGDL